jgi:peptidoglycan/xylan/chitin deacetylase (PgdA/CDA1 family)
MISVGKALYHTIWRTGWPRRRRSKRPQATIFGFHNVVSNASEGRVGDGPLHLGISSFERYVDWIAHAYDIVPLSELLGRLSSVKPVGGLACLTFDDGYQGVFDRAIPVLQRYRAPAAIFIVTGPANTPDYFWWDRVSSAGPMPAELRRSYINQLSGDTLKVLAHSGGGRDAHLPPELLPAPWDSICSASNGDLEFGAHTVTHRNLMSLTGEEMIQELASSLYAVRDRIDISASLVAYPYGRVTHHIAAAAQRIGYAGGLGGAYGLADGRSDRMRLPRVNVPAGLPLETLECWAAGLRIASR